MPRVAREQLVTYRSHLALLTVVLVAYPLVMPNPTPRLDPLFVGINLIVASLLVVWSLKVVGLTPSALGLSKGTVRKSLLVGGLVGLLAPAIAIGLACWPAFREVPWWGELDLTPQFLIYRVLFRIPLGTAFFEEMAFRGVMYGLLLRRGKATAIWLSSALFGLYHVGLTARLVTSNLEISQFELVALVFGSAVFTFVIGLIFAYVRHKGQNIAGPTLTHWMADASANILVFVLG